MRETDDKRMTGSDETARRVIDISLDNPKLGARRLLPLLRQQGVNLSESSVYRIMRQNGLNTKKKRMARLEEQSQAEPHVSDTIDPPKQLAAEAGRPATPRPSEPHHTPVIHHGRFSGPDRVEPKPRKNKKRWPSRRQAPRKTSKFITTVNAALVLLAVFIGYRNVKIFLDARQAPAPAELTAEAAVAPPENGPGRPARPLSHYRAVWERNLFNASEKQPEQPGKEIDLASVDTADESIGLTLIGTVAANTEDNRFAVIKTGKAQKIFHEGGLTGGFVVKKILRNKVIISSADGDRLLALQSGSAGHEKGVQQPMAIALSSPEGAEPASRNPAGGRFRSVELPFDELMAGLEDVDQLIQEVGTRPYARFGKHTGFRIESVPDDSILKRIGLRSHDAILAINGVPIKDETEARAFFQKLAEGEQAFIKYRRRNRTRQIELNPI